MSAPPGPDAAASEVARQRKLLHLSVTLFDTPDQTIVVEKTLEALLALAPADSSSFWMVEQGDFVCQLAHGSGHRTLLDARLPSAKLFASDPAQPVHAAEVVINGATIGALRMARDSTAGVLPFTPADRALLDDLAGSLGAALHAAIRLESVDKNEGLALVLEMSRQIGSSLDLDRVLRTVVNLATKAVTFDRGAIALYEDGKCDIRAVAGMESVDSKTPEMQDLAVRAAWAAGVGEQFYLADRAEPSTDSSRIFIQIFGEDLKMATVESGLYLPLKDEEGVVGILVFEAERPEFASDEQQELLTILANQTTVAIRNAQLYSRVPLAGTLGSFSAKRRELFAIPRQKRLFVAAVAAVTLAALTLIQWPYRVEAIAPTFRPTGQAEVRAAVPGVVEEVLVHEGSTIERGAPVARLRDDASRAEHDALTAAIEAAERAASIAISRGDATAERLQRLRIESLQRELAAQGEALAQLTLRAPERGIILTPRPEERIGAKLEAGDPIVLIGRTDSLELVFGVGQTDVNRVQPGDEIRLRVNALPQRTFVGHVSVVGQLVDLPGTEPVFSVRAMVPNEGDMLKPGMLAQARVLTASMSTLGRLIRTPWRLARLFWWRAWSWS
ncbi:MAG: efflux RND transporter periplasmic adaptor subunit [Gemmatimonadota bacterium]